jgi:anaerobic selenocysteine-containing dehydrogenase
VIVRTRARVAADVRSALSGFSPREAAPLAGVEPERIERLAQALVRQAPAVAIGGGDPGAGPLPRDAERAIALLDVVLGSVGREGGIVARRPVPVAGAEDAGALTIALGDVPAGSVGVLLLDGSDDGRALPWSVLHPVLAPNAVVVSLSPFDGALAREADVLVPAPAPLEAWDEVLPPAGASVASYAVSSPPVPAAPGAIDTVAFVQALASALGVAVGKATHEERLRERVAAIHATGRGSVARRGEGGYTEPPPRAQTAPGRPWSPAAAGSTTRRSPRRSTCSRRGQAPTRSCGGGRRRRRRA